MKPAFVLLAGPNGAGKSTFWRKHLVASGLPYLNADDLAAAHGLDAYEAARATDEMRRDCLRKRVGFISETVFSDPAGAKVALLRDAEAAGFDVTLVFIGLSSAELSNARVMNRVAEGGHDVPEDKIFARYPRSLENLARAINAGIRVMIYDNSRLDDPHRRLGVFERGRLILQTPDAIPPWAQRFFAPVEP